MEKMGEGKTYTNAGMVCFLKMDLRHSVAESHGMAASSKSVPIVEAFVNQTLFSGERS